MYVNVSQVKKTFYTPGNRANDRYLATAYIVGHDIIVEYLIIHKKRYRKETRSVVKYRDAIKMTKAVDEFFRLNNKQYKQSNWVCC